MMITLCKAQAPLWVAVYSIRDPTTSKVIIPRRRNSATYDEESTLDGTGNPVLKRKRGINFYTGSKFRFLLRK